MNSIDCLIIVIFALSAILGLARGLLSEAISLITLVAGFFIASTFSNRLAAALLANPTIAGLIGQTSGAMGMNTSQPISYMAIAISFALLFFATMIVGSIIKSLLSLAATAGILSIGNRILGALFGLVRGYILTAIFIFVLSLTPASSMASWQGSQYIPYFQPAVMWISGFVSPLLTSLKAQLNSKMKEMGDTVQNYSKQF